MSYQPKHMRDVYAKQNEFLLHDDALATASQKTLEEEPGLLAEDRQKEVSRSASMMSVLVIISRLTGFARTWAQSIAVGTTVLASCYAIANTLPDQLYELVGAGMLTTAFLPVYMSIKKKIGKEGANAYTSNLLSIVVIATLLTSILGIVFAGQVIYTQSFSANVEFDSELAIYFFRFFAIEIVLYCFSTIFSGVLNAERSYFWPMAAPIFNNFITTASFIAYALLAPVNPSLGLLILAFGNPLGVLVQVLVQIPSLEKNGIRLRLRINFHDPALRDTLKIGAPALIVVIANFITVSVQNSSQLSVSAAGGAISNYARLWYTLPYAILTVPLTTALFTELSDNWAKKNIAAFKRDLTQGVCQILLFTVPFMLYLIVFSVPLISIISSRQFEAEDIFLTAEFLSGLSLALPLYGVGMYLQKVCSAMRRMTLYAVAATLGSGVQVALLIFGTPYFGLGFVAATSAIFNVIIDIVMLLALRRRLGHIGLVSMAFAFVRSLGLGLLGSAVAVLIMRVLEAFIGPVIGSPLRGIINCFAAGIPAVLVTYGLAVICKFPEAAAIRSLLGRLRR